MPECPSCADPYDLGASFCQYCGYPLLVSKRESMKLGGPVETCTCANRDLNRKEARFCKFCGNSLLVVVPNKLEKAWSSILLLDENENIIDSWLGIEKEAGSMMDGFVQVPEREKGLLVLTDRKLAWLEESSSSAGETQYSVSLRIPLEKIRDVSSGNGPPPYVVVTDDEGFHVFGLHSKLSQNLSYFPSRPKYMVGKELEMFLETVMKCRAERKFALLELQRRERVQVVLDFSFLRAYMEKGGMMVQKINCANCGASMSLPESGNSVNCAYCKSTHRVEDVFEKIKQLIG